MPDWSVLKQFITTVFFCIFCAFILYELSGIIGKEMLSDKHITGKGKGYQNITFGKEGKKSLIVNLQYNVFAPVIYMLLIAAVLQYFNKIDLLEKAVFIVPCYYLVRGFMIVVISGKGKLYNIKYEWKAGILGCLFAYIVQHTLILSHKSILPSIEEFRTQLWLVFFALSYHFVVRIMGRSPSLRQNRVCTNEMKKNYILQKHKKFKSQYDEVISDCGQKCRYCKDVEGNSWCKNYLQGVTYSIMIYEDFNRTKTQRWCENILFILSSWFFRWRYKAADSSEDEEGGKTAWPGMTLGIMQVRTQNYINNKESVKAGCEKIIQSMETYIEKALRDTISDYYFMAGEPEACLEKICRDYNGAEDYFDAIKYIFYVLNPRSEDYEGIVERGEVKAAEIEFPDVLSGETEGFYDAESVSGLYDEGNELEGGNPQKCYLVLKNCQQVTIKNLRVEKRTESENYQGMILYLEGCTDVSVDQVEIIQHPGDGCFHRPS